MAGQHTCHVCWSDEHLSPEWCPHVWIDEETGVRVITPMLNGKRFDTGDAYDFTQTCDDMRDGDVVIAEHNGAPLPAILVQAWPTAIDGYDVGQFHTIAADSSWRTLDGGKYLPSVAAAMRYAARKATA